MSDILDTDICREILDRSDLSEDEKTVCSISTISL